MALTLLPGETVLSTSKANAVVVPSDYGLGQFATDHLMGLVGMAGREAIGGKLYVTNARIAFQAHAVNRLKGMISAPISAVIAARRYRSGLAVGVEIETTVARLQFVNWSAGKVLAAIEKAQSQYGEAEEAIVVTVGGALADLDVRRSAEVANTLAKVGLEISGSTPTWMEALSMIEWRTAASRPTRISDGDAEVKD